MVQAQSGEEEIAQQQGQAFSGEQDTFVPFGEPQATPGLDMLSASANEFGVQVDMDTFDDLVVSTFGDNLPPDVLDMKAKVDASREAALKAGEAARGRTNESQFEVLEDALRLRGGIGAQKIGTSEIFQKAGLTGFENLSQSMNARLGEMTTRYDQFSNSLRSANRDVNIKNQQLLDTYSNSLDEYKLLRGEYEFDIQRIDEREARIKEMEHDFAILDREFAQRKEFAEFEAKFKDKESTGDDRLRNALDAARLDPKFSISNQKLTLRGASGGVPGFDPSSIISGAGFEVTGDRITDSEGNFIARISSPFGAAHGEISGEAKHNALDVIFEDKFGSRNHTGVKSLADGKITRVENDPIYGGFAWVEDANGNTLQYAHMDFNSIKGKTGQSVKSGEVFGRQAPKGGTEGVSTAPHTDIRFAGSNLSAPLGKTADDIESFKTGLDARFDSLGTTDDRKQKVYDFYVDEYLEGQRSGPEIFAEIDVEPPEGGMAILRDQLSDFSEAIRSDDPREKINVFDAYAKLRDQIGALGLTDKDLMDEIQNSTIPEHEKWAFSVMKIGGKLYEEPPSRGFGSVVGGVIKSPLDTVLTGFLNAGRDVKNVIKTFTDNPNLKEKKVFVKQSDFNRIVEEIDALHPGRKKDTRDLLESLFNVQPV